MKIGIKFCGGCNPRYDRGREVEKFKETFPDAEWVSDTKKICDYWVISCGCSRECVNTSDYHARKEVIKLGSPMDYKRAEEKIKAEWEKNTEAEDIRKYLHVGQKGCLEKEITEVYMEEFAKLTGDFNRLHMEEDFANREWFGRRIVHGMIPVNLLVAVLGSVMPGDGGILLEQRVKFENPVFPGDVIKAEMELEGYTENKKFYIVDFHGVCLNGAGEAAVTMEVKQMMSKELFSIVEKGAGK